MLVWRERAEGRDYRSSRRDAGACFYVEEFRVAWTASTAGKSCIPRCSGISGMVGGKGVHTIFKALPVVWTAV